VRQIEAVAERASEQKEESGEGAKRKIAELQELYTAMGVTVDGI